MGSFVEGELVENTNGKWLWRTADGISIAVENLEDSHLRNIALFLMDFGYRRCKADPKVRIVWLKILVLEWQSRMHIRHMQKEWDEIGDGSKSLRKF